MGKIRVLARAALNGMAGRVVVRGPPVAHPCTKAMTTLVEYVTRCLYENTKFYTVLIVRSTSWLKLKSSHFRKCCEENFYLCVRLMQNHMEIFSTAAKLFVWRLRLSAKSTVTTLLTHGGVAEQNIVYYIWKKSISECVQARVLKALKDWAVEASNQKVRSQWSMKNVMDTPYLQQQPDWKFTNKHGGVS